MREVEDLLSQAVKTAFSSSAPVELTRPKQQFGDYATNVALKLSRELGRDPREAAQKVIDSIPRNSIIEKAETAGPGFINLTLSQEALLSLARKPTQLNDYKNTTAVIETNNPNPFKAMHIGHAFNAVLGDTIANLLEAGGAQTHRVSYHGDVGAHVGKSMYSLLHFIEGDVKKLESIPKHERNTFMSRMYAKGAEAYKKDDQAKLEIEKLTRQSFTLEDKLYKQVYEICRAWSFEEIDRLVDELGNKPTQKRYLESQADQVGVLIVKDNAGKVFIKSDGALVFPGEQYGAFDNVFVTSNGLGLYGARDLGLMRLKDGDFHPDKSYIVTAEEQKDYFKGVIKAAELCLPELADTTVNIPTGTVKLTTGKMSSRSGDVLEASWLFDKTKQAIEAMGGKPTQDIIAGSLRYQFLKVRIGSDVTFDVQEAVSLQGNSGPYLQYAHARARSILAKAKASPASEAGDLTADERGLIRKLGEYSDAAKKSVAELMPHHICTYLYELSQDFNRFYEHNRVIGDEREGVRLMIVGNYADTLKNGLNLLGIEAPQRM